LRQANATQIRVPADDTHTEIFFVHFMPVEPDASYDDANTDVLFIPPFKNPSDALHPQARFILDSVLPQDHMVWETQGPIADRTVERLATTDRGIVLFREILAREIAKVAEGIDPLGTVRDSNQSTIDTFLTESLVEGWYDPEGRAKASSDYRPAEAAKA
jgi:5,5'-dehydrodivanillate O-demethylase